MKDLFHIFCAAAIFSMAVTSVYAFESYGNPEDPVVAEVLGMQVRTENPLEMQSVINQKLFQQYARQNKIEASEEDIASYITLMDQFMSNEQKRRDARRIEIPELLQEGSLSEDEKKLLQSELATLEMLHKQEREENSVNEIEKEEILKIQQGMAASTIKQWKINKALYQQYGGRIIGQQMGPEPLDAMHTFLKEQQENGAFKILKKSFEAPFWEYFVNESKHNFYKQGSREEQQAFAKAPWLQN